jgi:serine/threonine protein kinase
MAEGAPPHSNIHPFRALFLIPKKPPPTFSDPSKWSPDAIDFVTQCLQKQPHERPSAIELLQHPFIAKRVQGPEVLRSTIIAYLKAKKEKQMRLKREIAKLGQKPKPLANSGHSDLSGSPPSLTPISSPRLGIPSPRDSPRNPSPSLPPPSPLIPDVEVIASPDLDPISNETQEDEDSGSPDYQTMFIVSSLNAADMPQNVNLNSDEETDLSNTQTQRSDASTTSKISRTSKNSKNVRMSTNSMNTAEFASLREMIIDAKIEICRVREEVSSQNAVLKNELHQIKSQLADLTTLMLAMTANSPQLPSSHTLKKLPAKK